MKMKIQKNISVLFNVIRFTCCDKIQQIEILEKGMNPPFP